MKYKFNFYSKIRKSTGSHGILFGYDASRFQLIEQKGMTFKNYGSGELTLHSQLATINVLLDIKTNDVNIKQNIIVVVVIHLKSKGGDIERYDEILDLLITLNRDYSDKEIIIMGDFNGEKETF